MIHLSSVTSLLLLLLLPTTTVTAFSSALFQDTVPRSTAPSRTDGVDIELPDFDELFLRIQQVSPLAKQVIQRETERGLAAIDDASHSSLPWNTVELGRRVVQQIEKIDNFQGHPAPILRFRSSMKGPCIGEAFGSFIMDLEQRKKWDDQIEQVYERYPINDLDCANIAMGFGKFGQCSRLGVGYCATKENFGISPREQLTLCGIQDFPDGSCIIWGTEMETPRHDSLFPPGKRVTRAKSHLFSTTLIPTAHNSFDVEYILQLEIGGSLPTWLTTPIVIQSVKRMFKTASDFFDGRCSSLEDFLKTKVEHGKLFVDTHSLLMTP